MTEIGTFDEFYRAVHGAERPPLPWQSRLARTVLETGWPGAINVPTGLGKTTTIEIAVWAMAAEAHLPPSERVLPTRAWYVVNRRLLVDEGFDTAKSLAKLLGEAETGILADVASALRARGGVSGHGTPLQVTRLRGGLDDLQLPGSPAQPAVICSTVPMFGSRLLFRGYGGARYTRPIETALASVDSLVLLDEAHLSVPLQHLVDQLDEADPKTDTVLGAQRSHPILVTLSATNTSTNRFDLDDDDLANPTVNMRLDASKPTELVACTTGDLPATIADTLVKFLSSGPQPLGAVVFVNSARKAPQVLSKVQATLKKAKIDADVTLLTGLLRPVDAEKTRAKLEELKSGRKRSDLERHHVVVATQTLEVGADLDFDLLITQSAGAKALTQRFGRLNRLGEANPIAKAAIVHPTNLEPKDDPVYGEEPSEVWSRLSASQPLNLNPRCINNVLGEGKDRSPRSPELLPNHLDEYMKTVTTPRGEAPVNVFFDGIEDNPFRTVQVAWRDYLPTHESDTSATFTLAPALSDGETVEVGIGELRKLVDKCVKSGKTAWRLTSDRLEVETVESADIRPGDQVVLPCTAGGYTPDKGWDATSPKPVPDRSFVGGQLVLRPAAVKEKLGELHLEAAVTDLLLTAVEALSSPTTKSLQALSEAITEDHDSGTVKLASVLLERLTIDLDSAGGSPAVASSRSAYALSSWLRHVGAVGSGDPKSPDGNAWVAGRRIRRHVCWMLPEADAQDELSATDTAAHLHQHLAEVGSTAERVARSMGLPEDLAVAVRNAGLLHDLGKADPRFQRWLGCEDEPLAKSLKPPKTQRERTSSREAAGWPAGGRHETLSVRIVGEAFNALLDAGLLEPDPDLVLHLIASHHGRGRPGLWGVDDPTGSPFVVDLGRALQGATSAQLGCLKVDGSLSSNDWEQPDRFARLNRRYGRRGLALIEAVLRQSDWVASDREENNHV